MSAMPGPIVSGVASFLVPGLGQILNGRYLRGGALLISWILVSAVVMAAAFFLVLLVHLVFILSSAVDAYRIAKSTSPGL